MDATVQFYGESDFMAIEVQDKVFDWMLSSEFETFELFISKQGPKCRFGGSHVFSKFLSPFENLRTGLVK
jgi:hypothetical protein